MGVFLTVGGMGEGMGEVVLQRGDACIGRGDNKLPCPWLSLFRVQRTLVVSFRLKGDRGPGVCSVLLCLLVH